jgi:hypothetical protein
VDDRFGKSGPVLRIVGSFDVDGQPDDWCCEYASTLAAPPEQCQLTDEQVSCMSAWVDVVFPPVSNTDLPTGATSPSASTE